MGGGEGTPESEGKDEWTMVNWVNCFTQIQGWKREAEREGNLDSWTVEAYQGSQCCVSGGSGVCLCHSVKGRAVRRTNISEPINTSNSARGISISFLDFHSVSLDEPARHI